MRRRMRTALGFAAAAVGAAMIGIGSAGAQTAPAPKIPLPADGSAGSYQSEPVKTFEVNGKKSGYLFASPETQAMQDDDFANPASLWLEQGEKLWTKADGDAGKSCGSCHGAAANLRGVGNTYPKVSKDTGKLVTIEDQINYCRTERMKAPALKLETPDMLGISMFVMYQSRGLPMNVSIDGPAKPYFEAGDKLYHTRRGQLNVACTQCHENNAGNMLRADLLSAGMSNGFPLYRLKWQRPGSFDYRMEECYGQVRAEPEPYGSEELKKLQLYVAWRSNGLPVETPAVRR
jgi:L-cysteine S-thiosulfotransferase